MGRKGIALLVAIVLAMPLAQCAEAGLGEQLNTARLGIAVAKQAASLLGAAFSGMLNAGESTGYSLLLGMYTGAALYDSALVPEHVATAYFAGLEASSETTAYAKSAWQKATDAKQEYKEAVSSCAMLRPDCPAHANLVIKDLAEANEEAMSAGNNALAETIASLDELGRLGGDLPEYGGEPFAAYVDFTAGYEGSGYSNFKAAMDRYGYIDLNGKASVECGGQRITLETAADCLSSFEVLPPKIAGEYYLAYNALIGANNKDSGILQVLAANTRLKKAITLMAEEHTIAEEKAAAAVTALREGAASKNWEIDYARFEKLAWALPQNPATLLEEATSSRLSAELAIERAAASYRLQQDNYAAESTVLLRHAGQEAEHGMETLAAGQALIDGMRTGLAGACDNEAATPSGAFTAAEQERIKKACASARAEARDDKAIQAYLDAIEELRLLKSAAKAELATDEIALLKSMIELAAKDFGVDSEKQELAKAERYFEQSKTLSIENAKPLLEKAYRTAVAAQQSIWGKARENYAGLAGERQEALLLMKSMLDIDTARGVVGFRQLDSRLTAMERLYAGGISLESLGHLAEAAALYNDIRAAAAGLPLEELLVMSESSVVIEEARCNEEATVHRTLVAWNPYWFWINDTLVVAGERVGPFGPREMIEYSYTTREVVLECGETDEEIAWAYPDHDERIATREIVVHGTVANAAVLFEVDGATAAAAGAVLMPEGIVLRYAPKNGTALVEYTASPSIAVTGPACESDGSREECRYVIALHCAGQQKLSFTLPRPIGIGDSVAASNGNAKNAGPLGIIVTGADCPGHSTIDLSYADLEDASGDMLSRIEKALGEVSGLERDDFTKRYDALKAAAPKEVVSRGGKLLGEIETAIAAQGKENATALESLGLAERRASLVKWFARRLLELPWLPTDDADAVAVLEKARKEALDKLAKRYKELATSSEELASANRLLARFGMKSDSAATLEKQVKALDSSDDYLSLAEQDSELRELYKTADEEVLRLAALVVFDDLGDKAFSAELDKAVDTEVDIKSPEFVLAEDYGSTVEKQLDPVVKKRDKGASMADGTVAGLEALDKAKIYPDEVAGDYERLVGDARKRISKAGNDTEKQIGAAESVAVGGNANYYALLARQSLEAGYVNRAYAYATEAQALSKSKATGLLTAENSFLVLAPLAVAALVWQLRKRQQKETPVKRAMRLAR